MDCGVGIKGSTHRHGFTDEDIRHALALALYTHYFDDFDIVIGPTESGLLNEVDINVGGRYFMQEIVFEFFVTF